MRVPLRHLVDHLCWTVHGTVWAVWRLEPHGGSTAYATARQREELLSRLTGMVRQLVGAPRLFGLCAQLDAGEVVARMAQGVDVEARPHWAEVCEASLELLDGLEMHTRSHWLAVPLTAPSAGRELGALAAAGWTELADRLGLRPAQVGADEVEAMRAKARQVEAALAGGVGMRPARPAEVVWMLQHAVHRGLEEPLLSQAQAAPSGERAARLVGGGLRGPSHADLGQVRLLEGGQSAAGGPGGEREPIRGGGGRPWWRREGGRSPVLRRWLEVEGPAGAGYQALLALAEQPREVIWPGGAWLAQLDTLPYPVDWVMDLNVVAAEKAKLALDRKKRELADQVDQYAAHPAGPPGALYENAADLEEAEARVGQSSAEVEVQSVTVLAVWGDSPEECDRRARALEGTLAGHSYRLIRPVGGQEALFSLFLPGAAAPASGREFVQHALSQDWAMAAPGVGVELGDARGALAGIVLDMGTVHPMLLDLAGALERDVSASVGVTGDLGGGKSVCLKAVVSGVVDRGGQALVVDRTPMREWAGFARAAAAGRSQVIDAAAAELSIDPLRVFPGGEGVPWALSYLTLQLGIGPMTPDGGLLHHAVQLAAADEAPSMAGVLVHLRTLARERGTRGQRAAGLVEMLEVAASHPLGRMVFDESLPALDLADLRADMIVFTTAGLTLPTRAALADPELLRQQPLEAHLGRAVLYLVAAICRARAFGTRRFAVVGIDEAYWLTSSPEGAQLVHEIVHDGRKHAAGLVIGSHDAEELGNEVTRGLLTYRFAFRHRDPALARRALTYLGLDADDEDLVRAVSGLSPTGDADRAGEALLRDAAGRIGAIRVLIPPVRRIEQAIRTTPGQAEKTAPVGGAAPGGGG